MAITKSTAPTTITSAFAASRSKRLDISSRHYNPSALMHRRTFLDLLATLAAGYAARPSTAGAQPAAGFQRDPGWKN